MTRAARSYSVQRLTWRGSSLGIITLKNGGRMRLTLGLGSGLARRPGDAKGTIWAVADRGPNLKIKTAIKRYGLEHLRPLVKVEGAKIMPRPDIGPMICQLRISGSKVALVRKIPLITDKGRAVSGLPPSTAYNVEPVFDLQGKALGIDPSGADTEGVVALSDGTFWIGDEYGPSLLHVGPDGKVLKRWVPKGMDTALKAADYPVKGVLPAIAVRRRINRGFEALAVSPDEHWLYLVFQSPLAHPGVAAFESGRHVRIWQLDLATGAVAAQYLYPLDEPTSFQRDHKAGGVELSDIKISEAAALGQDRLLILERISRTTKIYHVKLTQRSIVPTAHLSDRLGPTLEQLSAAGRLPETIPVLAKTLVLNTDDAPELDRDLEGLIVLSARELLLVNDNDFSVEGARTRFWRIRFRKSLSEF